MNPDTACVTSPTKSLTWDDDRTEYVDFAKSAIPVAAVLIDPAALLIAWSTSAPTWPADSTSCSVDVVASRHAVIKLEKSARKFAVSGTVSPGGLLAVEFVDQEFVIVHWQIPDLPERPAHDPTDR